MNKSEEITDPKIHCERPDCSMYIAAFNNMVTLASISFSQTQQQTIQSFLQLLHPYFIWKAQEKKKYCASVQLLYLQYLFSFQMHWETISQMIWGLKQEIKVEFNFFFKSPLLYYKQKLPSSTNHLHVRMLSPASPSLQYHWSCSSKTALISSPRGPSTSRLGSQYYKSSAHKSYASASQSGRNACPPLRKKRKLP